ncbi:MAG: 4-alpha-glucanotransferase [Deinococcota bacterium]
MFERSSGILLHPTSLPGAYGIGDLGEAFSWINFLEAAGQQLWQVMPLGPTGYGDSPYQCFSAFAGNPYLISLRLLDEHGFLPEGALEDAPTFPIDTVDYGAVIPFKLDILATSFTHFKGQASDAQRDELAAFREAQGYWLEDYALFMACKEAHGGSAWNDWDADIRTRKPDALSQAKRELAASIDKQVYWQWLFYEQWRAVKDYANSKGIQIIGDIPIFVAFDSADTWANPELFFLADDGNPTVVAGVPPDYYSATGQRWGNPLYRWDVMKKTDYAWWVKRFQSTLDFFDIARVDHFRGFEAYWEIPASEPTAVKGRWVRGPGQDFFDALKRQLGDLPVIAEDLGVITAGVNALRDDNHFPGMRVLQFAFAGDPTDPYLPHNYVHNTVVYTGTHDNDTTLGWYQQTGDGEKDFIRRYLARGDDDVVWELIRTAFASIAVFAIAPLQDVLRLDGHARMNLPGAASGNWGWRFTWEIIEDWLASSLYDLTHLYGRTPFEAPQDTPYRQSQTESDVEDA